MKKLRKDNSGFTLVELIVVLVILAILAAILVPALLGYIDDAKDKEIALHGKSVYTAAQSVASKYYGKTTGNNIHPKDGEDTTDLDKYIAEVISLSEMETFKNAKAIIYFEKAIGRDAFKISGVEYTENGITMHLIIKTNEWADGPAEGLGNSITIETEGYKNQPAPPAAPNP